MNIPATMVRDLTAIAGAALMAYGGYLFAPPLGFFIGGAALYFAAIIGILRSGPSDPPG